MERTAAVPAEGDSGSLRAQRRKHILEVACEQFLLHGYSGTSVDSIVAIVGGSKSTIYGLFGSKEGLLAEVVGAVSHDGSTPDLPEHPRDLRAELTAFACERMARVLSPLHIGIQQVVIAEAQRLPRIASLYFDRGPRPSYTTLIAYLSVAIERGLLDIFDIDRASRAFLGELLFRPYLERLFGVAAMPDAPSILREAAAVVDAFLARHCGRTSPAIG